MGGRNPLGASHEKGEDVDEDVGGETTGEEEEEGEEVKAGLKVVLLHFRIHL